MEIIIPISYIKCALVTAAAKDVRYYLNGLAILPHKTGAILESADGHRLTMLHIPGEFALPEGGAILPRDFCERIALGAGATNVYIHHNGETSAARITMDGHPEFLGVLMPVRVQDAPAAGDWAKEL